MAKKKEDLAAKSAVELAGEAEKLQKELFDLRFKHGTRQLADTGSLRKTRRQLARVLTVARQKQIAAPEGKG
jgi:large subunit ribosomal protein L29